MVMIMGTSVSGQSSTGNRLDMRSSGETSVDTSFFEQGLGLDKGDFGSQDKLKNISDDI